MLAAIEAAVLVLDGLSDLGGGERAVAGEVSNREGYSGRP
jgi:hypothetical protein